MLTTTSTETGGFDVETTTDLGAGRNQVSAVQHHDTDFLLYGEVFRTTVRTTLANSY
jgi:hypothetical protein